MDADETAFLASLPLVYPARRGEHRVQEYGQPAQRRIALGSLTSAA